MLEKKERHSPVGLVLPRCCCRQIPFVIQASIQTFRGLPVCAGQNQNLQRRHASMKSRCLSPKDGVSRPWLPDALQASVRLSQRECASGTRLSSGAPLCRWGEWWWWWWGDQEPAVSLGRWAGNWTHPPTHLDSTTCRVGARGSRAGCKQVPDAWALYRPARGAVGRRRGRLRTF